MPSLVARHSDRPDDYDSYSFLNDLAYTFRTSSVYIVAALCLARQKGYLANVVADVQSNRYSFDPAAHARDSLAFHRPEVNPDLECSFDANQSGAGRNWQLTYSFKVGENDAQVNHHLTNGGSDIWTNNQAEYMALVRLLEKLRTPGVVRPGTKVVIKGDSQLVINQVNGSWKVRDEKLVDLHHTCRTYLEALREAGINVTLSWHNRDQNNKTLSLPG